MKILKYNIITPAILMFCLSFLLISCEKDTITKDVPDQLFRPIQFTPAITGNEVIFTWVPISGASYSLELSRDSFLFVKELQIFSIGEVATDTVRDLWSKSRYSARIKAISKDITIKDSEYKQITFTTGTENVFYTVAAEDIGINTVLLKWDNIRNVSSIIVSTTGSPDSVIFLTDSDKSNGRKLIEGLKAGTNYTFNIYLGELMLRGTVTAKTKAV